VGSNIQVQKLLNAFFGNNFTFIILIWSGFCVRNKCDWKRDIVKEDCRMFLSGGLAVCPSCSQTQELKWSS
jgi:hypothetical protein